jgi:hypothetical protein
MSEEIIPEEVSFPETGVFFHLKDGIPVCTVRWKKDKTMAEAVGLSMILKCISDGRAAESTQGAMLGFGESIEDETYALEMSKVFDPEEKPKLHDPWADQVLPAIVPIVFTQIHIGGA